MASLKLWSEIHPDILIQIGNRLGLIDFWRSVSVCPQWRSTITNFCHPNSKKLPWLMLSSPGKPDSCSFFDFTNPMSTPKFSLSILKNHVFLGTTEDFIITVDELGFIQATNPITGAQRLLPTPAAFPDCERKSRLYSTWAFYGEPDDLLVISYPNENFRMFFYGKFLLSPSSYGSVGVIIYDFGRSLAFAHESDDSWTPVSNTFVNDTADILFHNGLLYVVNWEGDLAAFDITLNSTSFEPVLYVKNDVAEETDNTCNKERKFLVESTCGSELYLVSRYNSKVSTPVENSKWPGSYYRTCYFDVSILDRTDYKWTEVKSFGSDDAAMFVGYNGASMISRKDSSAGVFKKNCIYFSDDYKFEGFHKKARFHMQAFSMEDRTISSLDGVQSFKFISSNPI